MMHRLTRKSLWFLPLLVLGACTPQERAADQPDATAVPNEVLLTATEFAFAAPDTIPPGWTTFRLANLGEEIHYGHIVQLDAGRTVQELVDAYAEAIRTSGPRPKWVTRFGGPGGTAPGDTSNVTQFLEPGSYVWICPIEDSVGHPHFGNGEFKPFVVRASDGVVPNPDAAPEATVVVRLMDFSFSLDTPPPGRQMIRVENAGVEPHDLVLVQLAPGASLDDLVAAMNPEQARRDDQAGEPPPPIESLMEGTGGIAAIAPGMAVYFEADFTPGEYVLLCMATAPDGRSHIEHGMAQQLSIR